VAEVYIVLISHRDAGHTEGRRRLFGLLGFVGFVELLEFMGFFGFVGLLGPVKYASPRYPLLELRGKLLLAQISRAKGLLGLLKLTMRPHDRIKISTEIFLCMNFAIYSMFLDIMRLLLYF